MSLNETPRGGRIHIGIFGRRNSGKSSLINALTGQPAAIVSHKPGTTADPVFKAMELPHAGPAVFIDTAGFDDEGELGRLRVKKTEETLKKTDIGIIVAEAGLIREAAIGGAEVLEPERKWLRLMKDRKIPVIIAVSKLDKGEAFGKKLAEELFRSYPVVFTSSLKGSGIDELRRTIWETAEAGEEDESLLGDMAGKGDIVLLVMPQDIQAPKGRLILPQVQTIRELLDRGCTVVSTDAGGLEEGLRSLSRDPDLIITDSQCFDAVWERKPEKTRLTSFSILFAAGKGDAEILLKGALALDDMTEKSRILIAEACTHVPVSEDIGTVKIPALLRKKLGGQVEITNVRGADFPEGEDLEKYHLIIHCGGCMFNRAYLMSRIKAAVEAGVPVTNYGMVLAKFSGILDRVEIPRMPRRRGIE